MEGAPALDYSLLKVSIKDTMVQIRLTRQVLEGVMGLVDACHHRLEQALLAMQETGNDCFIDAE